MIKVLKEFFSLRQALCVTFPQTHQRASPSIVMVLMCINNLHQHITWSFLGSKKIFKWTGMIFRRQFYKPQGSAYDCGVASLERDQENTSVKASIHSGVYNASDNTTKCQKQKEAERPSCISLMPEMMGEHLMLKEWLLHFSTQINSFFILILVRDDYLGIQN